MKIFKQVLSFVAVIVLALVVKWYVFSPVVVSGNSMYPTLHNNDIMILDRFTSRFDDLERFEVIVVRVDDELLIKRIIGLPNEELRFQYNELYINDELVAQDFLEQENYITEDYEGITIPADHYFVMGDNRPFSRDSRSFGLVEKDQILGRASLILYPFDRFGVVEH